MENMLRGVLVAAAIVTSAASTSAVAKSPAGAEAVAAIDEGAFVEINGVPQWITIRGRDPRNPILLFLHGGPGIGTTSLAALFADWEKSFTIVQWDQPGGGGTYLKNVGRDPGPMTIARFSNDGLAVAQYALHRLHARKLILMGNSWGSLIGLEMVHARPDLFSAYVGTSQPVGHRGNVLGWQMAIDAAKRRGDAKAVEALEKVGPPPYSKIEDLLVRQTYVFPPALPMTPAEAAATADFMKVMMTPAAAGVHYVAPVAPPAGYDPAAVFVATQRKVFEETWRWEASHLGTDFQMPAFIFQGSNDMNTPVQAAREYFDAIRAPRKKFEVVAGAGHNIIAFHDALLELLKQDVLPAIGNRRLGESGRRSAGRR